MFSSERINEILKSFKNYTNEFYDQKLMSFRVKDANKNYMNN